MSTTLPKSPSLAPGFRFHPTDDELVSYYLKRRLSRRPIRVDAIAELDLYKYEPWDLPAHSRIRSRDLEWYFFSPLDRKYSNRSRTNRATVQGYWKTTGKDRPVKHGPRVVGMKKTLVFHVGRAPKGERTNWVMHEYRVEDEGRPAATGTQQNYDQDGYVVCRIFQKNGVGPQNGAQYGAPFVEEEWEVEEEAADCLVMMADVAEDEGIQAEEEGNRSDNNVDHAEVQANREEEQKHLECDNVLQVNPSVHDIDIHPGERTVLLDGAIESTGTSKLLDLVNEHGFRNNTNIIEDSKSVIDNGDQCPPNRDDGYLELKDLFNPIDLENSQDMNNALVDEIDEEFLHDVFDVEDSVGGNLNQDLKHPEFPHMPLFQENSNTQSNDLLNSFDGGFPSFEDEDLSFYDAPCHLAFTNEKIDESSKLNPLVGEPSSDESLDDFLAYFDASDDNMQYDIMGFSDGSEYFNSYIWDHSAVEEVSHPMIKMPSEASASSVIAGGQSSALYANNQYRNDFENFDVAPDFQRNDGDEKPMSNSLVNMLASISAPPAFASEFPSGSGKAVGHISTTDPGSAVRIAAGLIQIHGLNVPSNGEHWPLHKRGNVCLLLPYHDEVYKSVGFEPITKFQGGALSTMIRGGFSLFIFSAVILTLSYTVGMNIYCR